jgi:GNAT superfamily N-acetyltransferase
VTLQAPEPLRAYHDLSRFDSGRRVLDEWLRKRSLGNEGSGASRTYVVCEGARVLAYYSLSTGSVEHRQAPGRVRRNMPDPIPVMILGRLAVDVSVQGQGIGRGLLKDAILRTLNAAAIAGIRAILVHALDETAAAFYQKHGFLDSPIDSLTLMLPLEHARKGLPD